MGGWVKRTWLQEMDKDLVGGGGKIEEGGRRWRRWRDKFRNIKFTPIHVGQRSNRTP